MYILLPLLIVNKQVQYMMNSMMNINDSKQRLLSEKYLFLAISYIT